MGKDMRRKVYITDEGHELIHEDSDHGVYLTDVMFFGDNAFRKFVAGQGCFHGRYYGSVPYGPDDISQVGRESYQSKTVGFGSF